MANREIEVDVILFGIDGASDIKLEFPELLDTKEFEGLKAKEIRLCWLLGNRTSPIYKLSKSDRVVRALQLVYGQNYDKNVSASAIMNGDIPDNIRAGINKMESYNPEIRLRAKLMSHYMFDSLNGMITLSATDMAAMDIDEKKKYIDLIVKVHSELPSMVDRLESSYGVKTVIKATKNQIMVSLNDVLK